MHTGIERIADLLHEQVPGSDIMTKYCNPHCACQGLYTRSIIGHLLYIQAIQHQHIRAWSSQHNIIAGKNAVGRDEHYHDVIVID